MDVPFLFNSLYPAIPGTPLVPKAPLLFLPELLEMSANEVDGRLSSTLWDNALQQKSLKMFITYYKGSSVSRKLKVL